MPVKPLPPDADLNHLKYQAKDLLKARTERDLQAAQRIREFHPRFKQAADAAIFDAKFSLADAQLTISRDRGFAKLAETEASSGEAGTGTRPEPSIPGANSRRHAGRRSAETRRISPAAQWGRESLICR